MMCALVATGLAGLVGCSAGDPSGTDPVPTATSGAATGSAPPADEGRLVGELWLNPEGHGPTAVRDARAQGRSDVAAALAPLAEQPTATWFAGPGDPFVEVERLSLAAAAAGQLPVFVLYHVPGRDCGLYSAGGAADVDAYLGWVGSFAAGLGERPAVVVVEPDAVAQVLAGCPEVDPAERFEHLNQAVQILARQPGTRTYLDAGNSSWTTDLPAMADALRRSGIANADGFAVNVSNFQTTEDSHAYGLELSRTLETDGAAPHFVIDTSRNGAGPPAEDDPDHWCNPPDRSLGEPPTTETGLPRVDALLWVKQPGDSDGSCRDAPAAGQWWPDAALDLVDR